MTRRNVDWFRNLEIEVKFNSMLTKKLHQNLTNWRPENIYQILEYHIHKMNSSQKKCALCEDALPTESSINICEDCLKNADCCVGLEKLRD
jgi:hypothetical protein